MEGCFSTSQSPQWAVVQMEEEESTNDFRTWPDTPKHKGQGTQWAVVPMEEKEEEEESTNDIRTWSDTAKHKGKWQKERRQLP